jgi:hypothetical protein
VPLLRELVTLISALVDDRVTCVIATPEGARFFDLFKVTQLTGSSGAYELQRPGRSGRLAADAFAEVPATFNTINKWAAAISDTLALGLLNEATGLGRPIVGEAAWTTRTGGKNPRSRRAGA